MSRTGVLAGSIALVAVAAVVAGCGDGAIISTCALYQRSAHLYLVRTYGGTAAEVRQDCSREARSLSAGEEGSNRWVKVAPNTGYGGYALVCRWGVRTSLYARPGDALARTLCHPNRHPDPDVTVVLRSTVVPGHPFYVAIHGPRSLAESSARRFPPPRQVVDRPLGTKACQYRGPDLTITAYAPSKNAAADFCRTIPRK